MAAAIGAQLARGMAAAHAQGIVHGDLKPANIMVTPPATAKIMDFGTARRHRLDPSATQTMAAGNRAAQSLSGTPAYMSPEQIRGGPASPASDVFALGLILYEMLIARRVIDGVHLLDVLRQIDEVNPDRLAPQVPEPFAAILRGALIADPRERRLTAAQIAERLAVVAGDPLSFSIP
jgi:serine/threonine-protein kinase